MHVLISGGAEAAATSVQLYATYNTAASADLDLKGLTIGGAGVKNAKFPLTLTWEAGEIGEKVISIPVKTDKKVEGDEFLTLQLANPVGMVLGETDVCTVTIEDKDTYATLQDGIMNPNIKVSTKGDGKWTVGEGSALNESGSLGLFHAESPALEEGEDSTLALGGIKGNGVMTFYVRFVGDPEEEIPSELDVYNGKKLLGTITHGDVTNAWERYTITTTGARPSTTHDYHFVFTQGSDPETRVEMSDISWIGDGVTSVFNVLACNGTPEGGYTTGSGPYLFGKTAKLVAKPLPGWTFDGWYEVDVDADDDDFMLLASSATYSYKVTDHLYAAAFFSKIPYIRGLAGPADGGKVTGSGLCAEGKKVTLKASANKNFTFKGWYAANADDPNSADMTNLVATTASLVIDRSARPAASSKTSTTITGVTGDVTYFALFEGDPRVAVLVDPLPEAGKVTGVGRYAPGKKVTLKATANRGYVFNGWYSTTDGSSVDMNARAARSTDAGTLVSQAASYSFTMPDDDVALTAKFITSEEDAGSIALSVDAFGGELAPETVPSVTNICGVSLVWPVSASALSQPTIKVSGLPSGLKFTAKDIVDRKTKEVTVPANTIYGAPTAESKLDNRTGLRKPSTVKFTVTTAGKSKRDYAVDMTVLPLPDWAVGTFNGGGDDGQISLTVAKTGKLSGKYISDGVTWKFAADAFDSHDDADDRYLATLTGTSGRISVTNTVSIAHDAAGGIAESDLYVAYQNNWKLEPWKTIGKPFAKAPGLEYEDTASVEGEEVPGVVSLKFASSGAVTVKGVFGSHSASGSAMVAPQTQPDENGAFDAVVFVYLPPKTGKFDGYVRCLPVRWDGEAWSMSEVF